MIEMVGDENFVEDDFDEQSTPTSSATAEKKRQRELLRQIWMATEKDDMMTCLKILKKETP